MMPRIQKEYHAEAFHWQDAGTKVDVDHIPPSASCTVRLPSIEKGEPHGRLTVRAVSKTRGAPLTLPTDDRSLVLHRTLRQQMLDVVVHTEDEQ